jgi:hypothetical protein
MSADVDFLDDLVERFPELAEDYEVHVANCGEPLAHVFFWDVTQAVVHACDGDGASYASLDWRALIRYLDQIFPAAPREVREVIVTSFLLSLPSPAEPGYEIAAELGPALAERFKLVRPCG